MTLKSVEKILPYFQLVSRRYHFSAAAPQHSPVSSILPDMTRLDRV